ncbi:E3 ubiquitin-protein ligase TRIM39-like isoform X2 [Lepisosteus oculatus]|uniref:E3 ubiquitin-protein ligase TRIM39-like isoform X2 n=1 Tax=Lepisosteus oculatus TaxID=7918 RepID=UPI00371EEB24
MAEGSISVSQDQFSCSVCLDLLKDPVALLCGHSYCMGCIKNCWDQEDQTGIYSCPQCRQTFTPRPDLHRNTILAEVVEKLKETGLSGPPPAHSPAGPGDVLCDVCTGRQRGAVKSCLVCLASYCQTHLQPHYEAAPLKKHKLVDATGQLQEKICSTHDKLLEVYCRTDEKCVCYLCVMDEHRGHDTVSIAAGRTEKQKQLGETQTQTQQRLQEREKKLQKLRQAVESLRSSAHTAVQDTDRIFTELIRSIERTRSEVTELIRAQERAAVSQAEGRLERLEKEIAELKRRDSELNQLSHTEDHIHFLQDFQSVCVPPGAGDSPSTPVRLHFSPEAVRRAVSGLKERLEDLCKKESIKISTTVTEVYSLLTPEPWSRAELLHYAVKRAPIPKSQWQWICSAAAAVTLDPDTAHCVLSLSEDGKRVRRGQRKSLSDNPHRFDHRSCVVSREAFTSGRHYWEVEVNQYWRIGVTRESAERKGGISFSPQRGYWCLYSDSDWSGFSALTDPETRLPLSLKPRKLGVCVDIEERKVSFYTVESRAHVYTFTDMVFPQGEKIYPVFWTLDSDKDLELLPAVSVEIKPVTDS